MAAYAKKVLLVAALFVIGWLLPRQHVARRTAVYRADPKRNKTMDVYLRDLGRRVGESVEPQPAPAAEGERGRPQIDR